MASRPRETPHTPPHGLITPHACTSISSPRRKMRFVRHRCDVPNKESRLRILYAPSVHGSHLFASVIRILYNLDRTKRTSRWIQLKDRDAFDVKDEEGRCRWKDEVNTGYNHEEESDSYSNYSSCKEFPATNHPNVHSSRRRLKIYIDFILFRISTYVPKREYRCRLIPSAPLPASKGACSYYIGKLRSLVDIGDTSTSRKRFSCTGREQNPLVIGITSSLTLCTSGPVCVNGTRRTEKGYKVFGGSQYRAEATMQRGSLKWSLGDLVSTPSPSLTPQALIHHLSRSCCGKSHKLRAKN
ncbi:hypothetical protein ALC53_10958 [Atta colombica]|uniref:Uncharacterized protein n=1 Tax=Atta colombica TaxID=520822 RepID=A0A195B1D6_9HYME|nr:hypothetical protein ALC53_10958 [Atta colombica]